MKILCPQCEQAYEFDEQLIPVVGYMAHCSRCAHVFYLARAGIKSIEEYEVEQTQVIEKPTTALETQDDDSANVSEDGMLSESETREFSGAALEGADDFEMPEAGFGEASEIDLPTGLEGLDDDDTTGDDAPTQAADFDEMLALSGTLGEPLAIATDPYKEQSGVSLSGMLAKALGGVAAIAVLTVAGLYSALPDVYNEYFSDLIGVRAGVHPRVLEIREAIPPYLKSDTRADRQQALSLLKEGMGISDDDTELLGVGGLVYALDSIRYELKARLLRDEGAFSENRKGLLSKLPAKQRTPDDLEQIKLLSQRVSESVSEAKELDDRASRDTLMSSRYARRALERQNDHVLALVALALEATSNEKSVKNGDRYIKRLKTALNTPNPEDMTTIREPWFAVVMGYRTIYDPETLNQSQAFFSRAKELAPDLVTADLGLAEVSHRQADWSSAVGQLDGILKGEPAHELAKYWRGILSLVVDPVKSPSNDVKASSGDTTQKVKAKKKRKKNRKKKKRKKRSKNKRKPK